MDRIADYSGPLLSHVETLYRPGERDLAIELVEALGCVVSDTGFKGDGADTFLAVHPNSGDRDVEKNVFYMSQARPEQLLVEQQLQNLVGADQAFSALLNGYRQAARSKPFGIPHFAIRYMSGEAVRETEERINNRLRDLLGDRLHLRVFYPGERDAAVETLVQGFLHQDVIVSGSFLLGQVIELQARPSTR